MVCHGESRGPETFEDISEAIVRERQIEEWKRKWKTELIRSANPYWQVLYEVILYTHEYWYSMIILVHGGAGNKKPSQMALRKLSEALSSGFDILNKSGSALEAVTESIKILEDSGLFNAGAGGNLQFDGIRRLDASLMEGKSLRAGSVIGIEGIRNPILAAMHVMDLPNIILTNRGARRIASAKGLAILPKAGPNSLRRLERTMKKEKSLNDLYKQFFSTVGAVALDRHGNLAAGASTGGTPGMLPGRVGDTPIIGAGTYAENSLGAAACTGTGEYIVRLAMAKEICMNLCEMPPHKASVLSLKRLVGLGGQAGVICLNGKGEFVIRHTTRYMPSGYAIRGRIMVKEGFDNSLFVNT
jgi:beta-aspartyl-peptidase (threonine type)